MEQNISNIVLCNYEEQEFPPSDCLEKFNEKCTRVWIYISVQPFDQEYKNNKLYIKWKEIENSFHKSEEFSY